MRKPVLNKIFLSINSEFRTFAMPLLMAFVHGHHVNSATWNTLMEADCEYTCWSKVHFNFQWEYWQDTCRPVDLGHVMMISSYHRRVFFMKLLKRDKSDLWSSSGIKIQHDRLQLSTVTRLFMELVRHLASNQSRLSFYNLSFHPSLLHSFICSWPLTIRC